MKTTPTLPQNAALLAGLLERLEQGGHPDPSQFRQVAHRLAQELAVVDHDDGLEALLSASTAAAEVYENLNYQHAGLCRSLLDTSLAAEQQAREAIARAMRTTASPQ
ncbi:hypothetical protein [uncultured Xylophilus sp.]|uniref:hypothetical protein n=1 Tax=uncultured Xylophilus sp. TaxID=296832 RepID=UPI0025E2BBB8|nr:hypothetical protein [uncultured Xylophilus sp.]